MSLTYYERRVLVDSLYVRGSLRDLRVGRLIRERSLSVRIVERLGDCKPLTESTMSFIVPLLSPYDSSPKTSHPML